MGRRRNPLQTTSHDIAVFIDRTSARTIPNRVRELAKLHVLDGLATMLGGAREPSARLLRRHYRSARRGVASVLGTKTRLAVEHAALVNGVQGHVLDYDDAQLTTLSSRPLGQQTHPTSPVLAAVLALAESRRLSAEAMLTAYIVGVEVACRLGDAVDPRHYLDGFHPTGTIGVFGATAASAHLLRLKPAAIGCALGIAGTFSSGLRANRGTMAKGLNAGRAAESGVRAALLAAEGFTASENIFDDPMGFFAAACRDRVERKLLCFGRPFFFEAPGIALKLYPCAGVLHPTLDLLLGLRARYALKPDAIKTVSITLDADAARPLVYDRPKTGLESKFSLPFAAAVALTDGAAGIKQFTDERLGDRRIQDLMQRVKWLRRQPASGKSESGIKTHVTIELRSGAIAHARDTIACGHPARPASRADIEEKFRQCTRGILPPRRITRFLKTFWQLDRARSVAAWLRPLCPARR